MCPQPGEMQCNPAADSPAGTGNQDNFVFEGQQLIQDIQTFSQFLDPTPITKALLKWEFGCQPLQFLFLRPKEQFNPRFVERTLDHGKSDGSKTG